MPNHTYQPGDLVERISTGERSRFLRLLNAGAVVDTNHWFAPVRDCRPVVNCAPAPCPSCGVYPAHRDHCPWHPENKSSRALWAAAERARECPDNPRVQRIAELEAQLVTAAERESNLRKLCGEAAEYVEPISGAHLNMWNKLLRRSGGRKIMKTGIELIEEERERQISGEGWTAAHDDAHINGELSRAGAVYAVHASHQCKHPSAHISHDIPYGWPEGWSGEWWKPSAIDPVRNLVKAGALIAAEIDRLQRIKAAEGGE